MDVSGLCGGDDFLTGGIRFCVADVVGDGAVEQEGVLQYRRNVFTKTLQGDIADVLPVYQNRTIHRIIETGDKLGNGGFSYTGGTHKGNHLSRFTGKGNVL